MLSAILTPVTFVINGILVKHLADERVGFDVDRASFSAYLIVNNIMLLCSIPYWYTHECTSYQLWIAFAGGVFDQIGNDFVNHAYNNGPGGPVSAITGSSAVLLVVIECTKNHRFISLIELVCLILVTYGSFIMIFPEFFENYCFICFKKPKELVFPLDITIEDFMQAIDLEGKKQ